MKIYIYISGLPLWCSQKHSWLLARRWTLCPTWRCCCCDLCCDPSARHECECCWQGASKAKCVVCERPSLERCGHQVRPGLEQSAAHSARIKKCRWGYDCTYIGVMSHTSAMSSVCCDHSFRRSPNFSGFNKSKSKVKFGYCLCDLREEELSMHKSYCDVDINTCPGYI